MAALRSTVRFELRVAFPPRSPWGCTSALGGALCVAIRDANKPRKSTRRPLGSVRAPRSRVVRPHTSPMHHAPARREAPLRRCARREPDLPPRRPPPTTSLRTPTPTTLPDGDRVGGAVFYASPPVYSSETTPPQAETAEHVATPPREVRWGGIAGSSSSDQQPPRAPCVSASARARASATAISHPRALSE